jgi:hypothetical protein
MTRPTCNRRHDLIRCPFGTFFIWLERKFCRSSNGACLIYKFHLSRQESRKQVDIQNLSGCCVTAFCAVGPCIVSEPVGARPRVGARPPQGPGCSRAMNVISTNRIIPTHLIERSGTNPSGFTSRCVDLQCGHDRGVCNVTC